MKDSGTVGLVDILAAEKERRNKEIKDYEFMRDTADNRKRIQAEKENMPRGYDPSIGLSIDEYFSTYPATRQWRSLSNTPVCKCSAYPPKT